PYCSSRPRRAAGQPTDPQQARRLAVARQPHDQHASLGAAAVEADLLEVARLEVADGVLPEQVELVGGQHGGDAGRFVLEANLQGDPGQAAGGLVIDGDEVEVPARCVVVVDVAD